MHQAGVASVMSVSAQLRLLTLCEFHVGGSGSLCAGGGCLTLLFFFLWMSSQRCKEMSGVSSHRVGILARVAVVVAQGL